MDKKTVTELSLQMSIICENVDKVEDIMSNEINQAQKDKCCNMFLIPRT